MRTLILLFSVLFLGYATAAFAGEEVSYSHDGTTMKGYLATPANLSGKAPAVLVVHEWWGHDGYVRKRADMLAELGYVALAVDMYGDGKIADHPKQAGAFAGEIGKNMALGEARFRAAMAFLDARAEADMSRVAAIGYCFGGGVVLEMARRGLDLDAVVSFHGGRLVSDTPVAPGGYKAKVLVLNGADDPFVKPETIDGFRKQMEADGVDYRFINYPGAVHSFTNPGATANGEKFGLPLAYNAEVDAASWAEMLGLFDKTLK
jgi:dienelactone hydrolase